MEKEVNRDVEVDNHKGADDYETDIDQYLRDEVERERILGPFEKEPFGGGDGVVTIELSGKERQCGKESYTRFDVSRVR